MVKYSIKKMVYYPALKRNELTSHKKIYRKLKSICLMKEVNLKRLSIVQFQIYFIVDKAKKTATRESSVVARN